MQKKLFVKMTATVMAFAMAVTLIPSTGVAAAKKPKMAQPQYPLFEGAKETVKIKTNGVAIKNTKWTSTDTKVFTVKKKSNTKAVVTTVAPGEAKVKAVVKTKDGKKYTLFSKVLVAKQEEVAGGWTTAEDPTITDEYKKMVESVADKKPEYKFTPVALLATQVVAGTNFRFFCKATKDNKTTAALLEIYQDLSGGTEIHDVQVFTKEVDFATGADGGWQETETVKISDDEKKAFDKALEGEKTKYVPIAKIAQQVVAGFNYRVICEAAGGDRFNVKYYIAVIYVPADGTAPQLTGIDELS